MADVLPDLPVASRNPCVQMVATTLTAEAQPGLDLQPLNEADTEEVGASNTVSFSVTKRSRSSSSVRIPVGHNHPNSLLLRQYIPDLSGSAGAVAGVDGRFWMGDTG